MKGRECKTVRDREERPRGQPYEDGNGERAKERGQGEREVKKRGRGKREERARARGRRQGEGMKRWEGEGDRARRRA